MCGMVSKALAAALLAAASLGAAVPTIDQSLSMQSARAPRFRPTASYVAYTVQQANWDENEFVQQIWIAVPATGERYALTSGKKASSSPRWSPDSRSIAFVSDRDGKRQIYIIAVNGGEAFRLTNEEAGAGSPEWSPDGRSIAYLASSAESKARKDRTEKYGEFSIVGADYDMKHLWSVAVPAEFPADAKQLPKPEALTSGSDFTVSRIRLVARWQADRLQRDARSRPGLAGYRADLPGGPHRSPRPQTARRHGPNGSPKWSPDGRQIAYVTSSGSQYFYYTNRHIAVIPADGGKPRVLTPPSTKTPT